MNSSYSLSVGDNDNQNGRDAADNDDHCQGQQCSLCVAHSLHSFLYTSHHFRGSDLQNPSTGREKRLELLIDVQEFTIKKPWEDEHMLPWGPVHLGINIDLYYSSSFN